MMTCEFDLSEDIDCDDPKEEKLRERCAEEYRTCRWCAYLDVGEDEDREKLSGKQQCDVDEVDVDHCCDGWEPCEEAEEGIEDAIREAHEQDAEEEHLRHWWRWM